MMGRLANISAQGHCFYQSEQIEVLVFTACLLETLTTGEAWRG